MSMNVIRKEAHISPDNKKQIYLWCREHFSEMELPTLFFKMSLELQR